MNISVLKCSKHNDINPKEEELHVWNRLEEDWWSYMG